MSDFLIPIPGFVESPCDTKRRVSFSRSRDFGDMAPGTWGLFTGGLGLMTRCPKCGARAGLDLHSVDASGEVNPSYLCARGPICGYQVYVKLEEWDLPPKPPRSRWTDSGWKSKEPL